MTSFPQEWIGVLRDPYPRLEQLPMVVMESWSRGTQLVTGLTRGTQSPLVGLSQQATNWNVLHLAPDLSEEAPTRSASLKTIGVLLQLL